MTTAQEAAARIREALEAYDAATTGRDEAHAMGALMNASDPESLRALLAERDELAKDAARYRWLRAQVQSGPLTIAKSDPWELQPWSGDDPDERIDREMEKHRTALTNKD
jgi:hypothetical protein